VILVNLTKFKKLQKLTLLKEEKMASEQEVNERNECKEALENIQHYDTESLARVSDLGVELNFQEIVPEAVRLVNLYQQISINVLDDLPLQQIAVVKKHALADLNRFEEVMNFSSAQNDALNVRNKLVEQIIASYQNAFNALHSIISYSTSKSADFKRLETEARAMLQTIENKAETLTEKLNQDKEEADQILTDIRKVAGEQGVSQQAIYFKEEAEKHEDEAENKWAKRTVGLAITLGVYAFLSIYLHKLPWVKIENTYQTVQFAISKILIFAVISYMLYLSTKNYLAHKHNAVVNKHRQNALMTYTNIADAASEAPNRDVILTHAAACIFSPQPTGYSGEQSGEGPSAKTVVEMLSTTMKSDG